MKRTALFVICLLASVGTKAQSHSFRDTSYIRYEQFDFDAWVMADTESHGKVPIGYPIYPAPNRQPLLNDDILQYNYTDNPNGMEVVGLSAAVLYDRWNVSTDVPPEYLLLYDANNDTFEFKGRLQWYETDTVGRPDGLYLVNLAMSCDTAPYLLCTYGYGDNSPSSRLRIWDLYFDKPITVYDSFYVGGTSRFLSNIYSPEPLGVSSSHYIVFAPSWASYDTACIYTALWKMYHYSDLPFWTAYQWDWKPSNQFLMILPIIKVVDTSFANAPECPRVSGLFVRGSYTDTVTVQWAEDSLHQEFEVSYGREGIRPEEGTIVTVRNATHWVFTDTSYSDTPMVSYVRTVCREYDTLRWSGWSSSVRWRLHYESADTSHSDTTHHEGIEVPDNRSDLSRFVRLMPNPASESVMVMSSYGIKGLEVYDVRGERVLEFSGVVRGTSVGFNVTGWTKGTYVVLVRTSAGTIAKRLMVN